MGFDVKSIIEEGLQGVDDQTIIEMGKEEERIIISLDKDFGDLLNYPFQSHRGVILLRLKDERPVNVNQRLKSFFGRYLNKMPENALVMISEERIRFRASFEE
jgi:predicted nuclease of predicted toxin-antitoxin system